MKAYEEQKYAVWNDQVNANLMSYLKRNLLTKPSLISASGGRHPRQTDGTSAAEIDDTKSIGLQKSQG